MRHCAAMTSPAVPSPEASLVRALGVRQLAASIVNVTLGAGIFVLPAAVAAGLGAAAPLAYLVCAVAMTLIVTSFALAGSRVSLTGGIYAYVEVAFGPLRRLPGRGAAVADALAHRGRPPERVRGPGGPARPGLARYGPGPPAGRDHRRHRGLPRVRQRAGRGDRRERHRGRGGGQAAAPRGLPRGRRLLRPARGPRVAGLAGRGQARRDGAAPHLRVRRDRGGARARAARSATPAGRCPARSTWRSG